jgi:hypothetical protein
MFLKLLKDERPKFKARVPWRVRLHYCSCMLRGRMSESEFDDLFRSLKRADIEALIGAFYDVLMYCDRSLTDELVHKLLAIKHNSALDLGYALGKTDAIIAIRNCLFFREKLVKIFEDDGPLPVHLRSDIEAHFEPEEE